MTTLQRRLDRLEAGTRPNERPAGICFYYPQDDRIHAGGGQVFTLAEFAAHYGKPPEDACGELWTITTDDLAERLADADNCGDPMERRALATLRDALATVVENSKTMEVGHDYGK